MACGSGKLVADLVMGQRPAIRTEGLDLSRYDRKAASNQRLVLGGKGA
jgi:D-amino-acid dehydrogenase